MDKKIVLTILIVALIGVVAATYNSSNNETLFNPLTAIADDSADSISDLLSSGDGGQSVSDLLVAGDSQNSPAGQAGTGTGQAISSNSQSDTGADQSGSGNGQSGTGNNIGNNNGNSGSGNSIGTNTNKKNGGTDNNGNSGNVDNNNNNNNNNNKMNTSDNNITKNITNKTDNITVLSVDEAEKLVYSDLKTNNHKVDTVKLIQTDTSADGHKLYIFAAYRNGEVIAEYEVDTTTKQLSGGAGKDETPDPDNVTDDNITTT